MPVAVNCDCGKSLRVPDEKRGKRIKCPDCGEAVRVPDVDDADDEVAEDLAPRGRKAKSSKGKGKAKGGIGVVPLVIAGGFGLIGIIVVAVLLAARTSSKLPVADGVAWQWFQHSAGGFSVEVPNALHPIPTKEGPGNEFNAIQIAGEHPYAVHVNCFTLPRAVTAGKDTSVVLNQAAKVIAAPGKIEQQTGIRHNGHRGIDILVTGSKENRRSRLFFHHDVVIELAVTWKAEEPIAERDRFWNSIQFTRR